MKNIAGGDDAHKQKANKKYSKFLNLWVAICAQSQQKRNGQILVTFWLGNTAQQIFNSFPFSLIYF